MKKALLGLGLIMTVGTAFAGVDNTKDFNSIFNSNIFQMDASGRISKKPNITGSFDLKSIDKGDKATYKQTTEGGSKTEQNLMVEIEGSQVTRITVAAKNKFGEDATDQQNEEKARTFSVLPENKIKSATECGVLKSFIIGKNSGCVTVNAAACEYLATKVEKDLKAKIAACSDTFKAIQEHQKQLEELTEQDYKEDVKSISDFNGRLSKERSIYNYPADNLDSFYMVVGGLHQAAENCQTISSNQGFGIEVTTSTEGTEKKKSWWGKTKSVGTKIKNGVKGTVNKVNMPFVNDKPKTDEQ